MLIVNIIGGLGNQMFQYAAGRALSLERGVPLRLDISDFANYHLHQGFQLQRIFNCAADIANDEEIRSILGWQSSLIARRLLLQKGMAAFRRKEMVAEPQFNYWPGIKNIPNPSYLIGYWQSEKYFLDMAAQIRKDFSFRLPLESQNAEFAQQISQVNAVSLHVRRGDYASNPATTVTHGLCSLDYYRASIQHIAERIQRPYFFVFSDDIAWVKENLNIDFPHWHVNHNHGLESYNDMRLMSLCQHHIIANSSFSWWGAWLSSNLDKIVVAPKRWFANKMDGHDLIPNQWVII